MNKNSYQINKNMTSFLIFTLLSIIKVNTEEECGANCWKCDSPNLCTNCNSGFYLVNNQGNFGCQQCPTGCSQCYRCDFCVTCQQGYAMNDTQQTCTKCPENCISCEINMNQTRCSNCGTGSYKSNLNKQCQPCMQFCLECTDQDNCQVCALGFGFDPSDSRCQPCGTDCLMCSETINSTMECQMCQHGYYIDQNNPDNCKQCMQNCLSCNNQTFCTQCASHYYSFIQQNSQNLQATCQKCPDQNCINCNVSNPARCHECETGFIFNQTSQICVLCAKNCQKCLSNNVCGKCLDGYYQTQNNKCEICGTSCVQCSQAGNCTKCSGSYFLIQGRCQTCHFACAKCSAEGQCQTCISYQYALKDNSCQYCGLFLEKCISCINSTYCIQCDDSYYLYKGQCITNNDGMSVWGIILIVISIAIVLGALIFAIIKKKQSDAANQNENREGPYIQIP